MTVEITNADVLVTEDQAVTDDWQAVVAEIFEQYPNGDRVVVRGSLIHRYRPEVLSTDQLFVVHRDGSYSAVLAPR